MQCTVGAVPINLNIFFCENPLHVGNLLIAINAAAAMTWYAMVWKQEKGTGHLQEQEHLSRVASNNNSILSSKK